MKTLCFWYDFASTYCYLSAMRLQKLAASSAIKIEWKPFLLGPIFQAQGLSSSPFNAHAAKGAYMVRDMQRLTAEQSIPFKWPEMSDGSDGFPRNSLLASRVALVGAELGWVEAFTCAVFRAEFGEGADISNADTISEILVKIGIDPLETLKLTQSPSIKQKLREDTERAVLLGIFGAPSFTIGEELFWGNDRLESAFAWAQIAE